MVQGIRWNTVEVVREPARGPHRALGSAGQSHGFHDLAGFKRGIQRAEKILSNLGMHPVQLG